MPLRTLAVSELTRYLKDKLESDYKLSNLWVQGEISNFKRASSGHLYFTLKDERSSIRVVMFRSRAYQVPFMPENGMSVLVRGYVSIYEQSGQYQLYAQELESSGTGALHVALEQLKKKLHGEGLFDERNKKGLPRYPNCIGLVTSPAGAAVQDMIGILRRRWPGIKIILAPVKVQGNEAPREICAAIDLFNALEEVDLLIVGRGGGSLEELWAFNTELVARSIFNSRRPVISAVGHETDFTIADLVADLRAPTPSAAAELAVPDYLESRRYLQNLFSRLLLWMKDKIKDSRRRLESYLKSPAMVRPLQSLTAQRRQRVDEGQAKMLNLLLHRITGQRGRLAELAGRLQVLSPLATLARGFSICETAGGEAVKSFKQAPAGSSVGVRLHEGFLRCEVKDSQPGN